MQEYITDQRSKTEGNQLTNQAIINQWFVFISTSKYMLDLNKIILLKLITNAKIKKVGKLGNDTISTLVNTNFYLSSM